MSWLSDRLGTTGKTPKIIRAIGDLGVKAAKAFIPGASAVDEVLNLSGQYKSSGGIQEIIAQTGQNVDNAVTNAGYALDTQRQSQQLGAALTSPLGILVLILVAVTLLKD